MLRIEQSIRQVKTLMGRLESMRQGVHRTKSCTDNHLAAVVIGITKECGKPS